MGWFANKLVGAAVDGHKRELTAFTANLAAMDGDEIGAVVACANHQRLVLLEAKGWDFLQPAVLADHPSNIPALLVEAIKGLQRDGKQPLAAGVWVWLHTVRAMRSLELRQPGREMWRQLAWGFPYVEAGAASFSRLTGIRLRTDGAGQFPDGLSPNRW